MADDPLAGLDIDEGLARLTEGVLAPALAEENGDTKPQRRRRAAAARPRGARSRKKFCASIFPGPEDPLPDDLTELLRALERAMGMPVWLLIQQSEEPLGDLGHEVRTAFYRERSSMTQCGHVALVVESPGGYARSAYQIATLFRRHCTGFVAVVPTYAKSAATLLTLGANEIFMGLDAELGPLDAQLRDPDREQISSALDEVQALERLHSVALDQFDQTMMLLTARTQKKVETLLPLAMSFTAQMMAPLLDKIDTVHYTQQSRVLKEAEEYAVRLLQPRYPRARAEQIARRLVNTYTSHSFVIDRDEARSILDLPTLTNGQESAIRGLEDYLNASEVNVIGWFRQTGDGGRP